jgi:hypothetical protein
MTAGAHGACPCYQSDEGAAVTWRLGGLLARTPQPGLEELVAAGLGHTAICWDTFRGTAQNDREPDQPHGRLDWNGLRGV